jgi:hypothetical protein
LQYTPGSPLNRLDCTSLAFTTRARMVAEDSPGGLDPINSPNGPDVFRR